MEFIKQPVNLKNKKTMATIIGTVIIFLALPFTVLTILQTREPAGRAAISGGAKWTPFMRGSDQFITGLAVDPFDAKHAFITVDVSSPRETRDGGDHWYIPGYHDGSSDFNYFSSWTIFVSPYSTPTNKIIFTGGKETDIYRSSDGDTWTQVRNETSGSKIQSFGTNPNDSQIYFAGTGNIHDWAFGYEVDAPANPKAQVFKSTNGGGTALDPDNWKVAFTGSGDCVATNNTIPLHASIFDIQAVPGSSNVLFAATDCGLFKSTNADNATITFARAEGTEPNKIGTSQRGVPEIGGIQINPLNTSIMWATEKRNGVYCTSNGGLEWTLCSTGLTFDNLDAKGTYFGYRRLLLVKDATGAPQKLYLTNGAEKGSSGGLWVSNDLVGPNYTITSWTRRTRFQREPDANVAENWAGIRGFHTVAVAPEDSSRPGWIWAQTRSGSIYRSKDAGENWEYVAAKTGHPDNDPTPAYYANNGVSLEGLTFMTADPTDPTRIYGGDVDHGLFGSVDSGYSARRFHGVNAGNGAGVIAIDPSDNNKLYLGTYLSNENNGGVDYSTDGGRTEANWKAVGVPSKGLPTGNVFGLQVDKNSTAATRRLIAAVDGVGTYLGTHDTAADTWTWVSFGLNAPDLSQCNSTTPGNCGPGLSDLETDPFDSKRMYVVGPGSARDGSYPLDGSSTGVYYCNDILDAISDGRQCDWTRIDDDDIPYGDRVKGSSPNSIAIDPINQGRIYVMGENGVWMTDNALVSPVIWQEITYNDGTPIKNARAGVVINEGGNSVLYVGSMSRGVVRSENSNGVQHDFYDFNDVQFSDPGNHTHDLKYLKVRGIDYDPSSHRLFASTQGNGSYEIQLATSGKIGDLDGDGDVDIVDLSTLITDWGKTGVAADINQDGTIDVFDLSILLSNWGT